METWLPVKGFEGLYEISDLGRVKSLPRNYGYGIIKGETILRQKKDRGYCRVALCCSGEKQFYQVHRLVAEAFIPNPDNLPVVNHMDENKANNCVGNLMWCTHRENSNWGNCRNKISNGVSKPVQQLSKQNEPIKTWKSMSDAARETGVCLSEISKCTRNHHLSAGGYKWRYSNEHQLD